MGGHGNLMYDLRQREMRKLPSQEEVEQRYPSRQSSLYGRGRQNESRGLEQEPVSFREQKAEVIHRRGKRGSVKIRDTGIKAPKRSSERAASQRSYDAFD